MRVYHDSSFKLHLCLSTYQETKSEQALQGLFKSISNKPAPTVSLKSYTF